jgi:photosystem II Psb28-2 protein
MAITRPYIQIFAGVVEELSGVSLRQNQTTGNRSAIFIFDQIEAIKDFICYRKTSANVLHLIDEEGEILAEPSGVRFFYGGPEGEDIKRVECRLDIDRDDHWERIMRFLHRYGEANNLVYSDTAPPAVAAT